MTPSNLKSFIYLVFLLSLLLILWLSATVLNVHASNWQLRGVHWAGKSLCIPLLPKEGYFRWACVGCSGSCFPDYSLETKKKKKRKNRSNSTSFVVFKISLLSHCKHIQPMPFSPSRATDVFTYSLSISICLKRKTPSKQISHKPAKFPSSQRRAARWEGKANHRVLARVSI